MSGHSAESDATCSCPNGPGPRHMWGPMECPPRPPAEPLACNAQGIRHDGHKWDFGSGETFQCPGDPNGVIPPGESDA